MVMAMPTGTGTRMGTGMMIDVRLNRTLSPAADHPMPQVTVTDTHRPLIIDSITQKLGTGWNRMSWTRRMSSRPKIESNLMARRL